MKAVLQIILLIFCSSLLANQEPIELSNENLTLLALKHSSQDILSEYAFSEVKSKHTKKYFKLINKPEELKVLVENVRNDIELSVSKISKQQLFKTSSKIKYRINNESESTIQISDLYTNVFTSIFRSYKINKGLPDYYKILIANLEILDNIQANAAVLNQLKNNDQKQIFADITFKITGFQNQQDFQAIIQEIKLYKNQKKTIVLAEIKEDRAFNQIVDNWLLSDGFTSELTGIHAFSVFGYRLHDEIRKSYVLQGVCEKSKTIDIHQVIVCNHPYTENTTIVAFYVGGILAQLDLIAKPEITTQEKSTVIRYLSNGLKMRHDYFSGEQKSWSNHSVDFEFQPSGLDFLNNKTPSNKYKLVFSMTSHAMNKIFEGVK